LQQQTREQHSNLLEANSHLKLADGVYQNTDTQIRESHLSNYIQGAVDDSYDNVTDLSLFSIDIEKLLLTDELRAALSPAPFNFLLSFDFSTVSRTLDLTQDFGGVSHFLADKVESIDSVKIDLARARMSIKRCAQFDNITTISEDIKSLSFAEKSYDLIIVSQLEDLELNKLEQAELLKTLQLALSTTGRLVVNVRNRDRLNKWTSTGSDITAYRALYKNEVSSDFNENEFDVALKQAGFLHWDSYASYSQGRAIQNLLSKKYLASNPHALNHFNRLGGIGNGDINEYLLFKNLHSEREQIFDLASRFVIVAGASATRTHQLCHNNFAHFSGAGRKPQWRVTTMSREGSNKVSKTLVHPNFNVSDENKSEIQLSQTTDIQEFQSGPLLLDEWLAALLSDNPPDRLNELVSEYAQWLSRFEKSGDFNTGAYDVLPFNIIIDSKDRSFKIIDPEWIVDAKFGSDFILFRALFWFAFENKALLKQLAKQTGLSTISLFVLRHMDNLDSHEDLAKFVEMEEEIQRQIGMNFRNKSIEYALLQTFDGEPIPQRLQPACQISWSDEAGIVDEHNSVFISWKASTQEQTLSNASPSFVAGKSILRIDPIASMGLFRFSSVKIVAKDDSIIWQLNSAADIIDASEGLNVTPTQDASGDTFFTALNEDPHFLFDLGDIKNIDSAQTIEVSFALLHNQYYDNSLASLSKAVSEQNVALFRQVGVFHTKQAEIEYLSSRLENIDAHRQALQVSIHQAQKDHEEHAENLTNALNAQIERVRQIESNIVIRNIFRAKRVASRILSRFIKKTH